MFWIADQAVSVRESAEWYRFYVGDLVSRLRLMLGLGPCCLLSCRFVQSKPAIAALGYRASRAAGQRVVCKTHVH